MADDLKVNWIIREKCETLGISEAELGRKIGLTRYKVWACFTGRRRFTAGEFIRICRAIDLSINSFMEVEQHAHPY